MQAKIKLPKAFSVRDGHEFLPIQHLMNRLNPKLSVKEVATGVHVDGGGTVHWQSPASAGRGAAFRGVSSSDSSSGSFRSFANIITHRFSDFIRQVF